MPGNVHFAAFCPSFIGRGWFVVIFLCASEASRPIHPELQALELEPIAVESSAEASAAADATARFQVDNVEDVHQRADITTHAWKRSKIMAGVSRSVTSRLLLPKSCGHDGIIRLIAGRTYGTCPGHVECRKQESGELAKHTFDTACHTLLGAQGAHIEASGTIYFKSGLEVRLEGPLLVTMAPGTLPLDGAVFRHANKSSSAGFRLDSPHGTELVFMNISSSGIGAAIDGGPADVVVQGEGQVRFENLYARRGPALHSHKITIMVANFVSRNCTSYRGAGGALKASSGGVLFASSGNVSFEDCRTPVRGGAVASGANISLIGTGNYSFVRCTCDGADGGLGGALSAAEHLAIRLSGPGLATFVECVAHGHVGGGALGAGESISLETGVITFQSCDADNPKATIGVAGQVINITALSDVRVENGTREGFDVFQSKYIEMPAGGKLTTDDVFASYQVLAARGAGYGVDMCPPGSRFGLRDDDGGVPAGTCSMCKTGTASLASSHVEVEDQAGSPRRDMSLVLVRKHTANVVPDFVSWATKANSAQTERCESETEVNPWACVGPGVVQDDVVQGTVKLVSLGKALNFTFDGKVFAAAVVGSEDCLLLNIPGMYSPGRHLRLKKRVDPNTQQEVTQFHVNGDKSVSPLKAPHLAIGYDRDVNFVFHPEDPYDACVPCHRLAPLGEDRLSCPGGSHVHSKKGYMIMHSQGNRTVRVHRCLNKAACPGSNLTIAPDGMPTPDSRMCQLEYDDGQPGCTRCSMGHGRPGSDPFTCKRCASPKVAAMRHVGFAVFSSAFFYSLALMSVKPRTCAQQECKIFLSFMTLSGKCVSAIQYTLHYKRISKEATQYAAAIVRAFFTSELIITIDPGELASLDCMGLVDGPSTLIMNLAWAWSVPLALLILAVAFYGPEGWLFCSVLWGNLFLPALVGATSQFFPCASTSEGVQDRVLMYEAGLGTPCSAGFSETTWMQTRRNWLGAFSALLLFIIGPVLWLQLIARREVPLCIKSNKRYLQTWRFLVCGYESHVQWWEVTVLARKCLVFLVATLFPMSWAPAAHLAFLLLIVIIAMALHGAVQPYEDVTLNRLEMKVLGTSATCIVLVMSSMCKWPFMPYTAYLTITLTVLLLIGGAYMFIIPRLLKSLWFGTPDAADGQSGEATDGETNEAIVSQSPPSSQDFQATG